MGFNKAGINFLPTFKYDIMRTLKRLKPKSTRSTKCNNMLADIRKTAHCFSCFSRLIAVDPALLCRNFPAFSAFFRFFLLILLGKAEKAVLQFS